MNTATTSYEALQNNYLNHLQQDQQNQHLGKKNLLSSSEILNLRRHSNSENISLAQFSLRSGTSFVQIGNDSTSLIVSSNSDERRKFSTINLQIYVAELQIQKCLTVNLDELVWDIKKKLFDLLPQKLEQFFNYGLFLPPCDGRAGKFLLEDRPIRDYPFHDCVSYVELKYKKRVYKTMQLDEKAVKKLHSKSNLKKFMDYVINKNAEKIDNMCKQGFDPNFHDSYGDSPLTKAAGVPDNCNVLVQLIGGGAHLDFRNSDGQTALHKASFESITENVKTLLELGASPNYRDLIGLTPLYYNMLRTESNSQVAELLLSEGADLFVVDIYANNLLHQVFFYILFCIFFKACKNGLEKHVENLLFYGAEINAQNINGNTPLHVCAVNNRVECAYILLCRGADPTILNKSDQSAINVAYIVKNIEIADVIQRHSPENIVPFCGTPKLNNKRRLVSSQLTRRRSLSYSSMANTEFLQTLRQQSILKNGSLAPILNDKDYDTLKKYSSEIMQFPEGSNVETNIPRILVIPRGPNGFGFILRGANHSNANKLFFQPSLIVPALQFFEGVETTGMAMRAGLRPGDFLLEINGVDVRCASHEQVVDLINQTGDTISLKVITINTSVKQHTINNAYGNDKHLSSAENYYYSSLIGTKRDQSVPCQSIANIPPMPPQRSPTTSLSFRPSILTNSYFSNCSNSIDHRSQNNNSNTSQHLRCASVKTRPSPARRISAAELEHLMIRQSTSNLSTINTKDSNIFSNIQNYSTLSPNKKVLLKNDNKPKKFTSISEMKRHKEMQNTSGCFLQRANSILVNINEKNKQSTSEYDRDYIDDDNLIYNIADSKKYPLKSFNSSPNLAQQSNKNETTTLFNTVLNLKKKNNESECEYSHISTNSLLRPKTPPPPPPKDNILTNTTLKCQKKQSNISIINNFIIKNAQKQQQSKDLINPTIELSQPLPLPPPTLSSNFIENKQSILKCEQEFLQNLKIKDCRGISAEELLSVKLKPVSVNTETKLIQKLNLANLQKEQFFQNTMKSTANFNLSLESTLSKNQGKLNADNNNENSIDVLTKEKNYLKNEKFVQKNLNKIDFPTEESKTSTNNIINGYRQLNLCESVCENVQSSKNTNKIHHSPPGSLCFATKKDSGYTSSRTSLEPSEFGDESPQNHFQHNQHALNVDNIKENTQSSINLNKNDDEKLKLYKKKEFDNFSGQILIMSSPTTNRITLINQQLEDTFYDDNTNTKIDDNSSEKKDYNLTYDNSNFIEMSCCLNAVQKQENDDITKSISNLTDNLDVISKNNFCNDKTQSSSYTQSIEPNCLKNSNLNKQKFNTFCLKKLFEWSNSDVYHWLTFLNLNQYAENFHNVTGKDLMAFDRVQFTQLGVTRVAHRQAMEQSLKDFK